MADLTRKRARHGIAEAAGSSPSSSTWSKENMDGEATIRYNVAADSAGILNINDHNVQSRISVSLNKFQSLTSINFTMDGHCFNQLPVRFVDILGMSGDEAETNIVYRHFDKSLHDYICGLRAAYIPIPAVDTYNLKYWVVIRGVHVRRRFSYNFVPEEYRRIFKDMIGYLCQIHDQGMSMCLPVSLENFVIFQNKIMAYGMSYQTATRDTKRANVRAIHDIIVNIFGVDIRRVPPDMESFMDALFYYKTHDDLDLLYCHPALMSYSSRIRYMKVLSEMKESIESSIDPTHKDNYESAIVEMGFLKRWTATVVQACNGCEILLQCFRPSAYDDMGYGFTNRRRRLLAINQSMIRSCRNVVTHLREVLGKFQVPDFGEKEIDIMVMSLYYEMLIHMQKTINSISRQVGEIPSTWAAWDAKGF